MVKTRTAIGGATDPDERIRIEWGQNLADVMATQGVTIKSLRHKLAEEFDVEVSRQAVEAWLAGTYAPRPHMQGLIGAVLHTPARTIFPINNPAKAVA